MNRTARTVPALLLAVAVVVMSIAGSASAAKLVTSKDIKNGTIVSIDVANGSLTRSDLRVVSRTSVVAASNTSGVSLETCDDTGLTKCEPVRTIGVKPGSQLITASATIDNTLAKHPSITNRCGLVQGDTVLAEARFTLAGNGEPGENAQLTLQQVITVPDASLPVSLRCTEMPDEALQLETADLTSVRTGY